MKNFSEHQEQYKNLLCEALELFYKNDANELFKENDGKNASEGQREIVNERAMSGCVYRYMWYLMQQKEDFTFLDIDIEYDRMVKDDLGYYVKSLPHKCNGKRHKQCTKKCCEVIGKSIEQENENDADSIRKAVRPDIIVHNRNKSCIENNGLVVEFKKYNNNKVDFDMAKLYYFTCPESESLQYQLGAMVKLFSEYAYVAFIGVRKILSGCKVSANRVEEVKGKEIEKLIFKKVG